MIVPVLLALAVIIAAAKFGGWLASLLGQPTVLGKLVIGLLLGPSVINIFGYEYFEPEHLKETLHVLGEIGVIFLMFYAGLEIDLVEMRRSGLAATLVGTAGVIVPLILGMLTCLAFGYDLNQATFIGVVLTATSVSISAQTLMELGQLRSKEGMTILGAAVVDDVEGIAVLSAYVAIALGGGGGVAGIGITIARMLIFLVVASLFAYYVAPRLISLARKLPVSQPVIAATIIFIFLFAWSSEYLGQVAAITGAFVLGAGLSASSLKHEIEDGVRNITYALLVPIFLVNIGLTANLREVFASGEIVLAIMICVVAIAAKIIGCGLGARLSGMNAQESLRVGVGMISRGEVGLIVAGVGVTRGVIGNNEFTVAVMMVIVTTLVTPPLLRIVFRDKALQPRINPV